jgi:hypothetical protein
MYLVFIPVLSSVTWHVFILCPAQKLSGVLTVLIGFLCRFTQLVQGNDCIVPYLNIGHYVFLPNPSH